MKTILFLALILTTGCATLSPGDALLYSLSEETPKPRLAWDLNPDDKKQMTQFFADQKECADFAFKAKVAGSPYYENEIQIQCLKRRGYKTRLLAAQEQ